MCNGQFLAPIYDPGVLADRLEQSVKTLRYGAGLSVLLYRNGDDQRTKPARNFDSVRAIRDITDDGLGLSVAFATSYDRIISIHFLGVGTSVHLRVVVHDDAPLANIVFAGIRDALQLTPSAPPVSQSRLNIDLHPAVYEATEGLFKNGHYRHAILEACVLLNTKVQQLTSRADLDGVPLMQQAFTKDHPLLRLSSSTDEQLGFMWLFSGAMMALRNPKAHRITDTPSREETVEWLGFMSALFRLLDKVQPLPPSP